MGRPLRSMRPTRIGSRSALSDEIQMFDSVSDQLFAFWGSSCRSDGCSGKETADKSIGWRDTSVLSEKGLPRPVEIRLKDQLRAIRAATLLAQRALLETVKELRIDSQTKVENRMVQEDVINTRIEGTIQGAEIVKQNVRWEGDTPIATVELRICLSGVGACKPEKSIINALDLDQKNEPDQCSRPETE